MTHQHYARLYFYSLRDETLAPVCFFRTGKEKKKLWEKFSGASFCCVATPPRERATQKSLRAAPNVSIFSNELLPWRRLQRGGGGVMATARQTPREVLFCRCVSHVLPSDLHHLLRGVPESSPGSCSLHLHPPPPPSSSRVNLTPFSDV